MKGVRIGIVAAEFNKEITDRMLEAALYRAKQLDIDVIETKKVFGSYDTPLIVKKLLKKKNIHGVVVLGAIIQGETEHDRLIAYTVANRLSALSLRYRKPVASGIMGPRITKSQAKERITDYAFNAVDAVVKSINTLG